jgi:hypothetical protein
MQASHDSIHSFSVSSIRVSPMAEHPLMVRRSDAWRLQYRADRYARHLSQPELNQRLRDLVLNLLRVWKPFTNMGSCARLSRLFWQSTSASV